MGCEQLLYKHKEGALDGHLSSIIKIIYVSFGIHIQRHISSTHKMIKRLQNIGWSIRDAKDEWFESKVEAIENSRKPMCPMN